MEETSTAAPGHGGALAAGTATLRTVALRTAP